VLLLSETCSQLSNEGEAATPFIGTKQKRFQIQSAFKTTALSKPQRFQIKALSKTKELSTSKCFHPWILSYF
jgi:hypothetical protein